MTDTGALKLTKNQNFVFEALVNSDKPMSAYQILDVIREKGIRAPLQVYRALDKLREDGLVHRLESLNAFVACQHPNCKHSDTAVFMICDDCNKISEVEDEALAGSLSGIGEKHGFDLKKTTVELRGSCGKCKNTD